MQRFHVVMKHHFHLLALVSGNMTASIPDLVLSPLQLSVNVPRERRASICQCFALDKTKGPAPILQPPQKPNSVFPLLSRCLLRKTDDPGFSGGVKLDAAGDCIEFTIRSLSGNGDGVIEGAERSESCPRCQTRLTCSIASTDVE